MFELNISNHSNLSDLEFCLIEQNFQSSSEFFHCFKLLFVHRLGVAVFGTLLVTGIVLANLGLIIHKLRNKISIYDQIIIGNCIVDGLTGVVDVPFFLIANIFGYWPFGKALSLYWASYDNNINTTTALHMLYMIYVSIRNVKNPKSYKKEIIIRKPYIVMACIWAIGLTIWIPITLSYGTVDYTVSVDFRPVYLQTIINFFSWFLIDMAILILTIYMSFLLFKRSRKIKTRTSIEMTPNLMSNSEFPKKKFGIATLIRCKSNFYKININKNQDEFEPLFFLVLITFIIQWMVPCILILVDPLCLCISRETNEIIYWLTFTVCFTGILYYNFLILILFYY
jgi:hypothetical protein